MSLLRLWEATLIVDQCNIINHNVVRSKTFFLILCSNKMPVSFLGIYQDIRVVVIIKMNWCDINKPTAEHGRHRHNRTKRLFLSPHVHTEKMSVEQVAKLNVMLPLLGTLWQAGRVID